MTPVPWRVQVAFVGRSDEQLQALLRDVLRDWEVELVTEPSHDPDLVFAIVGLRDPFRILAAARVAGRSRAPIIAIIPITDDRLSQRALLGGARFCWPLDGPLASLRAAVLGAVRRPERVSQ